MNKKILIVSLDEQEQLEYLHEMIDVTMNTELSKQNPSIDFINECFNLIKKIYQHKENKNFNTRKLLKLGIKIQTLLLPNTLITFYQDNISTSSILYETETLTNKPIGYKFYDDIFVEIFIGNEAIYNEIHQK